MTQVTKAELIANIATASGNSKAHIEALLTQLATEVALQLNAGHDVTLPGIGKLSVSVRAAREGRNPKTGEPITIKAAKRVKFSATKSLKAVL
ncbi:MAG: HU family DNA-binding protein [Gammaproteobacteria bacterium]|nr:HU family DNA-binding protein [Gammaproteobacteria bacterium]